MSKTAGEAWLAALTSTTGATKALAIAARTWRAAKGWEARAANWLLGKDAATRVKQVIMDKLQRL
jgi:hypothetical protein